MTAHPTDGLIRAFLDDEIEPAGRQEILAHLDDCAACRGMVQEVRTRNDRVTLALERLDTMPPTDLALAGLKRRLRETAGPRLRMQGLGRAAAVALLLGSARAADLCPDGSYVDRGPCQLCPDGSYVGAGHGCGLAPDGSYVPNREGAFPRLAPDGSFVPGDGPTTLCPDGSYVSGRSCRLAPDGSYVAGD